MNKVILFSLLTLSLPVFAQQKISKKMKKRTLPKINIELSQIYDTNIDKLESDKEREVFSNEIKVDSKFKFRPIRKSVLIYLPKVTSQVAAKEDKTLRQLGTSHTFIGLLFPKRGLIYSGSAFLDYQNSNSKDSVGNALKSHNYSVSTDIGVSKDHSDKFTTSLKLKTKILNEVEKSSITEEFKNDYLEYGFSLSEKVKLPNKASAQLSFEYEKKLFKNKRALFFDGSDGSNTVETLRNYEVKLRFDKRNSLFKISPRVGYKLNKDQALGAKDYKESIFNLNSSLFITPNTTLSLNGSYRLRDYDNYIFFGENAQTNQDRFNLKITNISSRIDYKKVFAKYDYSQTTSNNKEEENKNHKFGLGLNFQI